MNTENYPKTECACYLPINPFMPYGISNPINWTNPFRFLGVSGSNLLVQHAAQNSAASDLVLYCLSISLGFPE